MKEHTVHGCFSSSFRERGAFFCLQILCSPRTTHWVSRSSFTDRVVPTEAFLMSQFQRVEGIFPAPKQGTPNTPT